MKPTVLNRHPRADYLKPIMTFINSTLGLSVQGYFCVLEVDPLSMYPNPLFHNAGFHVNLSRGGIEEMSPDHIIDVMQRPDCRHLIWMSKETCEGSDIHFAWIYSHEVRHLLLCEEAYDVSELGAFLYRNLSAVVPGATILDIPTELACELTALSVTEGMFGRERVTDYSEKKRPGYLEQLKARSQVCSVTAIREECCRILRRHRPEFQNMFRDEENQDLQHHVDIFEICAE